MLKEICQGNQKGDREKPIAKTVRELWQALSKTVRSAEWSENDGVLWFRGKIYVPWNLDLRRQIVSLCHDMKVARHPGVTPLENFLRKCNMGYTLYPWISLLESTLETSYKPQT